MIAEAELRRQAAVWGVDPMVVDLDYGLGWFLAAFYAANENAGCLRFKGGTCLRKCYFGDYRFSEDLDFTATAWFDADRLRKWIGRAAAWSQDRNGPVYDAAPWRVEMLSDTYGGETYQVRVYYRGPLRYTGSPRAIRLDVTRNEVLLTPAQALRLRHPYSDAGDLGAAPDIVCYSPEEIFAEKLRAVGGQRRFAVSRDLYDIHRLVQAGVSISEVIPLMSAKLAARGIDPISVNVGRVESRRDEFERDWQHRLSYLVQGNPDFAQAWATTLDALRQLDAHYTA